MAKTLANRICLILESTACSILASRNHWQDFVETGRLALLSVGFDASNLEYDHCVDRTTSQATCFTNHIQNEI
ncbi:MAG: hypothetical protein ACOVQM_19165 [Pirellula sp.]